MSIISQFTISAVAPSKVQICFLKECGVFYFRYIVWMKKFSKLVETLRETSNKKNFVQNVNSKHLPLEKR